MATCRQRPGSGRWYWTIELGRDSAGRRKQRKRGGYRTKRLCEEALAKAITERRDDSYVEPSREPLGVYLDRWLDQTAQRRKPATNHSYAKCLARLPQSLRDTPLAAVTPLAIQHAETDLLQRRAPATVRASHNILKMALAQAVRWRLLTHNPASGVDAPRVPRRELQTWTAAQVRQFLAATADDDLHPLWRLLLDTGMRSGEAAALRWADVDLTAGRATATIRRTVTAARDGRHILGDDAKTPHGRRTVPISEATVTALKQHQQAQRIRRVALGPLWQDHDLVFDRGDGRFLTHHAIWRGLKGATAATGLPALRPHGLRHTNATLLILAGVPASVVQQRLGHSTIAMTLDLYVHPDAEAARGATDVLTRLLAENDVASA